jgi:carbamoyltransferase
VIFLGISQDRYESGICLADGGRVVFAANEERYTRRKNQGGFPQQALAAAFRTTGIAASDVGHVCCAGLMTPPLPLRAFPRLHHWFFDADRTGATPRRDRIVEAVALHTPLAHTSETSALRRVLRPLLAPAVRRTLPRALRQAPISFTEHHGTHAHAAWSLSGFPEALAITADSMGDGLSASVGDCRDDRIERLWSAGARHSLGRFYEIVTEALGFLPSRHEGKVTGLAAHGDPARIDVGSPFSWQDGQLIYAGQDGSAGVAWVRDRLLRHHRREDVCAWAQAVLEENLVTLARTWLARTGHRRLVVAGGVFANVRLNQRLHALAEVDDLFVCPNMGDGGLALGAVAACGGLARRPVADVFWGDEFPDVTVGAALDASGFCVEEASDVDDRIAAQLARGGIVGVFRGRMEWGPRALGNRSILASATAPEVSARLNRMLVRSDFMPFAPAILAEQADDFLRGIGPARSTARFMTCCFDATDRLRREHPAVVHVDGTVRAQIVDADANPALHRVLVALQQRTGSGVVLNTSFNRHEEPIVRTPQEAIDTFRFAGLDALAIGPYWIAGEGAG